MKWMRLCSAVVATFGLTTAAQADMFDLFHGWNHDGCAKSCGCAAPASPAAASRSLCGPVARLFTATNGNVRVRNRRAATGAAKLPSAVLRLPCCAPAPCCPAPTAAARLRLRAPVLPAPRCCAPAPVLRCSEVLPGSGLLLPGSGLCSDVLRSPAACSGSVLRSEVLPGSGLRLPGSGLCSEVLRSPECCAPAPACCPAPTCGCPAPARAPKCCPAPASCCAPAPTAAGSEVLCPAPASCCGSGRSGLQHVQQLLQQRATAAPHGLLDLVPSQQGRLLRDALHDDQGLLCRSLRSC